MDGLFSAPPETEEERMIEAVLFASTRPLGADEIARRLPEGAEVERALARLRLRYEGRGVRLVEVAGGWAFRTAPDLAFLLQEETREEKKLSRAAVETLAIVAYHQPVTRAEIDEIRGVAVSRGTLDLLLELGWIGMGARRRTPGRPATFVTTPDFLDHFGLSSVADLPGLEELKAAGLLGPVEPAGPAIAGEAEEPAGG
jgi:segregation and condensation protein B